MKRIAPSTLVIWPSLALTTTWNIYGLGVMVDLECVRWISPRLAVMLTGMLGSRQLDEGHSVDIFRMKLIVLFPGVST